MRGDRDRPGRAVHRTAILAGAAAMRPAPAAAAPQPPVMHAEAGILLDHLDRRGGHVGRPAQHVRPRPLRARAVAAIHEEVVGDRRSVVARAGTV